MFHLSLISCLESMLSNLKDLFHTSFWPNCTSNLCNWNPPVIQESIFLWAASGTEVSLRFRSFICYPFAQVLRLIHIHSSDISPVTIPLHRTEEKCFEVWSCHFLHCMLSLYPPFLIWLPTRSSLKGLKRKRLMEKIGRPGYSASTPIFAPVSLCTSISFCLTSFLSSHICPAKEGICQVKA